MRQGRTRFIIGALAGPITIYAVLVLWPYLQSFYVSLTDWSGYTADRDFIGLANYARLLADEVFWIALRNNVVAAVVLPIASIGLGLFFATMITVAGRRRQAGIQGVRGGPIYRVVYFFPHLLSIAVIGVLWSFVYDPTGNGLLNGVLGLVGVDPVNWLGSTRTAYASILAVIVWMSVGFYVLLFTAAMASIPPETYEAAMLDGAGRWRTFWRITIPLIWDTVQVALVYAGINALDMFAIVNVMSAAGGSGGPNNSTQVLGNYIYSSAFEHGRFGYATALGVALFVITIVLATATLRLTRRDRVAY
ncbi:carbohydrate ABC transporter permease [Ruania alba]|uniref:N-acetylglucosamine ABC transporter membrane protein /chitobiose ABC transporter membrane protein n=1 Tax=Ruania alba TaxID=648782 RepID=A0A1H5N1C3_9MICO|nr:sugar ABC transporter permease [Ruania alba]SEE95343.1 N-acetylglucosamine ABC transporter membrane protein /chitobiose ABC transporter membrane protein [Ruania alba]